MSSQSPRLFLQVLFFAGLFCFVGVVAKADGANVPAGQTCSLSVTADGTAPFSYQWFHDGVLMNGSTSATFTSANFQASDAGVYYAVVSNSAGFTTSSSVTLALVNAPVFVTQPLNKSVTVGASVIFSVTTSGSPQPTYQWRKNGVTISGATGASYALANVFAGDAGTYSVVATNSAGSATSAGAVLTVDSLPIVPVITAQPLGGVVITGSSVTFTAAASGSPAPTFQWNKNGAAISGATSTSYTIASAAPGHAGTYTVIATNSAGYATSSGAVLGVTLPLTAPAFTMQPVSQTVTTGASLTFTAAASGSPAPAYQWLKNGVAISGATSGSYTITAVAAASAGTYTVVATNSAGSVTSSGAVLTVKAASTPKVAADFNGDGRSDIVWQNILTGQNNISIMSGTTSTATVAMDTETPDWVIVGLGDFNSDGKPDILWENSNSGRYGLWLMNGTSFSSWVDLGVEPANWRIEGVGDFNGDGKADIIWQNVSTHERTFQLMNGTTAGATISLGWVNPDWHVAGTGDFDGDGKTDILWQRTSDAHYGLWFMNGPTFIRWFDLGGMPTTWFIRGCGDYNGDGKTDILLQNSKTGECKVSLMDGSKLISTVPLAKVSPEWIMAN